MTALLAIGLMSVAVCGTALGCGIVRIIRAVVDYRARRDWSNVLNARTPRV